MPSISQLCNLAQAGGWVAPAVRGYHHPCTLCTNLEKMLWTWRLPSLEALTETVLRTMLERATH